MNQLRDESFSTSALSQSSFQGLTDAYSSTCSLFKNYHDESTLVVYNKLNQFIKQDLAKLVTSRTHFDSMSTSLDEALQKNATISRQRPGEIAEYRNELTAVSCHCPSLPLLTTSPIQVGTCFAHTSLDYVAQINLAHARKDHVIIDAVIHRNTENSFAVSVVVFCKRNLIIFFTWACSF